MKRLMVMSLWAKENLLDNSRVRPCLIGELPNRWLTCGRPAYPFRELPLRTDPSNSFPNQSCRSSRVLALPLRPLPIPSCQSYPNPAKSVLSGRCQATPDRACHASPLRTSTCQVLSSPCLPLPSVPHPSFPVLSRPCHSCLSVTYLATQYHAVTLRVHAVPANPLLSKPCKASRVRSTPACRVLAEPYLYFPFLAANPLAYPRLPFRV